LDQPLPKNQNSNNNQTEIINFNVVKQVSSLSGWVAKKIKHLQIPNFFFEIIQIIATYLDALTYEKEFGEKIPYRLKYCSLVFINCIHKTYKITKIY
jgi:hypothetical protein